MAAAKKTPAKRKPAPRRAAKRTAKKTAPRKKVARPPTDGAATRIGMSLLLRVAGLEDRMKAEARVASLRLDKLETRLERMAQAIRVIRAEGSNPADSEDE